MAFDKRTNPTKQAPLTYVRVRGRWVDISSPAILCFLYSEATDEGRAPFTAEFDYRWNVVKSVQFQWDRDLRDTTKWLIAQQISIDVEEVD